MHFVLLYALLGFKAPKTPENKKRLCQGHYNINEENEFLCNHVRIRKEKIYTYCKIHEFML